MKLLTIFGVIVHIILIVLATNASNNLPKDALAITVYSFTAYLFGLGLVTINVFATLYRFKKNYDWPKSFPYVTLGLTISSFSVMIPWALFILTNIPNGQQPMIGLFIIANILLVLYHIYILTIKGPKK